MSDYILKIKLRFIMEFKSNVLFNMIEDHANTIHPTCKRKMGASWTGDLYLNTDPEMLPASCIQRYQSYTDNDMKYLMKPAKFITCQKCNSSHYQIGFSENNSCCAWCGAPNPHVFHIRIINIPPWINVETFRHFEEKPVPNETLQDCIYDNIAWHKCTVPKSPKPAGGKQ